MDQDIFVCIGLKHLLCTRALSTEQSCFGVGLELEFWFVMSVPQI